MVNELHLPVRAACIHPFGIGLFRLESVYHRDIWFYGNPHEINGVIVRFVRHDREINRREENYTRYGCILMLGYPLDYRTIEHVDQSVASFGKFTF